MLKNGQRSICAQYMTWSSNEYALSSPGLAELHLPSEDLPPKHDSYLPL